MHQHPTVEKFQLRTYTSQHDEGRSRCAICRKKIQRGDSIAQITPIRDLLRSLGVQKTKVFKYAHQDCLPLIVSEEQHAAIKQVVDLLMAETDPMWPEDNKGFDRPGAAVAEGWIRAGYPRLGAERLARHMLRFHRQVPADLLAVVKTAAELKWEPKQEFCSRWANGWLRRDAPGSRKEVFLGVRQGQLAVRINKWQNPHHEDIYRAIKGLRGRWESDSKCWLLDVDGFGVGNLEQQLGINRDQTEVACSMSAWAKLNETRVEKEPVGFSETTIYGIPCQTWKGPRYDGPRRGEVIIEANGQGLKVYLDAPWQNPAHGTLKDELKRFGARWDKDTKSWRLGAAALTENFDLLADQTVILTEDAATMLRGVAERQELSRATDTNQNIKDRIDAVLPENKRLYPFQYAGVEFVDKAGGRALISDDMGCGKSIEAIGYLALHPELRPAVLVVPAVVTGNWVNELNAWLPGEKAQRIKTGKQPIDPEASIYVITYDLLKKQGEALRHQQPKLVVGDEVQLVKTAPKTDKRKDGSIRKNRTQVFVDLVKHSSVQAVIGLSGTPIVNRPLEFYTFLNLLDPAQFGSWKRYTARYCDGHHERIYIPKGRGATKNVWVCDGASNTEELNRVVRSLMIRRRKEDVLTELPAKQYQTLSIEMKAPDRTAYNKAIKAVSDGPGSHLAEITAARQAADLIKAKAALEMIQQYCEAGTPLLVFGHYRESLDVLEAGCQKLDISYGRIDHATSQEKRTRLVADFQAGKLDCMLLGIRAAGVGITLTRASDVLFVGLDWTPGQVAQAEDRVHRIGQDQAVTIRYLEVTGTVDEDMLELLERKREVLEAVLDGDSVLTEDLDIRAELVERWKQRAKK